MKSFADLPPDNRFGADYYEHGESLGLSLYQNYHYMPRRSIREALTFLDYMGVLVVTAEGNDACTVLDWGCAKGFFVKALLTLGVDAIGVDVSEYAVSAAELGICSRLYLPARLNEIAPCQYGYCKDVLEHCQNRDELRLTLSAMADKAEKWLLVVPLADSGFYRIPAYEKDTTHSLRLNEAEWLCEISKFMRVRCCQPCVRGIKDKWFKIDPCGNMVVRTDYLDLR